MTESEMQLEQIEISDKQAKEIIGNMNSLLKLIKNKDWKRIIDEGYFEKEASRLVLLKADPNLQKDEDQKALDNSIIAIAYFRQYLQNIMQFGRMAERDIVSNDRMREEILAETLGE